MRAGVARSRTSSASVEQAVESGRWGDVVPTEQMKTRHPGTPRPARPFFGIGAFEAASGEEMTEPAGVVHKLRLAMMVNGIDLSGSPGGPVSAIHGDAELED